MWGAGRGFAPCRVRAGRLLPNPKAAPARAGPLGKLSVRRGETTTGRALRRLAPPAGRGRASPPWSRAATDTTDAEELVARQPPHRPLRPEPNQMPAELPRLRHRPHQPRRLDQRPKAHPPASAQQPPEAHGVPGRPAVQRRQPAPGSAPRSSSPAGTSGARVTTAGAGPSARSYLRTANARTALTTSPAATASALLNGHSSGRRVSGRPGTSSSPTITLELPFRLCCRRRSALLLLLVSARSSAAAGQAQKPDSLTRQC